MVNTLRLRWFGTAARRLALFVLVCAALALGASSAQARVDGYRSVVWSNHGSKVPAYNCLNMECTVSMWLPNGSAVGMYCWADTVNQKGNYYSPRWFIVRYTRDWWTRYLYIHSSYVYYQTRVPHC